MNNSKLVIENMTLSEEKPIDRKPFLRQRESEIVKIFDAIAGVQMSKDWSTLKNYLFDGLVQTLNKEIHEEARKENPDTLKLNRLAGQLKWAEKYSDLNRIRDVFRLELTNIRKQLYNNTDAI